MTYSRSACSNSVLLHVYIYILISVLAFLTKMLIFLSEKIRDVLVGDSIHEALFLRLHKEFKLRAYVIPVASVLDSELCDKLAVVHIEFVFG